MLKRLLNECQFELNIKPQGPILIKSGISTVSGPDMSFVETFRDGKYQPYLPGSSLKGVLRSHGERITNTIKDMSACMPFEKNGDYMFCGTKIDNEKNERKDKQKLSNAKVYYKSCPICKLFGSTSFAGRISISDAYSDNKNVQREKRDGVGIDRFTGGAADRAKFDLEPVIGGVFKCSVYVRNFEIWQLGLIGCLMKDLKDGYIYLGSGKSRGLGKVVGEWENFTISFPGRPDIEDKVIPGVGSLLNDEKNAYGYKLDDSIKLEKGVIQKENSGIRTKFQFDKDSFNDLMDKSIDCFFNKIKN